jgi:hypothetical protein
VDESWDSFERELYVVGCQFGKKLPYGHSFFRYNPDNWATGEKLRNIGGDKVTLESVDDLRNIREGKRPVIFTYGAARHWQMGDETKEGSWPEVIGGHFDRSKSPELGDWPVYFTMNWYSVPNLKPKNAEEMGKEEAIKNIREIFYDLDFSKGFIFEKQGLQYEDVMELTNSIIKQINANSANENIGDSESNLSGFDEENFKAKIEPNKFPVHNKENLPDENLNCDYTLFGDWTKWW